MKVYFLKAPVPLTKTFERHPDKTITKTSYPHVFNVTSIEETFNDLKTFAALLTKHAALDHCLIKGVLNRPLVNESRAGSTDTNDETEWICLDIDGLSNAVDIEYVLDELGLSGISYVVQYSASYKVENNDLRAHVYMLIDRPTAAPTIKQWLIAQNLNTPLLSKNLRLTRTGNTLHWPLDISTCQNDKLIYIATPVFKGMKNPVPTHRVKYVRKARSKIPLSNFTPNAAINKEQTIARINQLRAEAGLPKRTYAYKFAGTTEYLVKPDLATITGIRNERGFVYFNLNGGDSWAYYHPEHSPEFIYNFKNEPIYRTQDLLPDYWKEQIALQKKLQADQKEIENAQASTGAQTTTQGLIRLAFCDPKASLYYRGFYDPQADYLELNPARSEKLVRDFAKQYGMPLGDYIPEWSYTFNPHSPVRVDPTAKVINIFQATEYMRTKPKTVKNCPAMIYKVIHHALGSDRRITAHFMNWLAVILQLRTRTLTGWVLHGTTGTGKGVMMDKILRPLFGRSQTVVRRAEELNERYNDYMERTFLIFIDEIETKALVNERGAIAKLKHFMTEPFVSIRRMYANSYEVPNYTNWIFASNKPDPVAIDKEDRRFNIGTYQPVSNDMNETHFAQIASELQAFHDYLMTLKIDVEAAATPIDTIDRENLISISENAPDTVASALRNGDMSFFIDLLPTDSRPPPFNKAERLADYKHTLSELIGRTQKNAICAIARDELKNLFEYTVGGMPDSPNKFTSYLKHRRIYMTKVWVNNKTVNGIRVTWRDTNQFKHYREQLQ